ncbi:two pore domain potassium channel family protein [Streptomyces sp. WAC 06738]|uniref:potassium channel family protein n=1 Tax=Streptomyces sp. WAC 06738 TaxID=2203210 RepID=UPI000F705F39|nr:potassium channel family protein [Streptomyces sp. WAC 06738]AZM45886.1 two pore domain potassium channel family protein [Streptomyces sp. WAC 06738]
MKDGRDEADDVRGDGRDGARGDGRDGARGEGRDGAGGGDRDPRAQGRRRDPLLPWLREAVPVAIMVVAYFLLPLHLLGAERPELSWTLFVLALGAVTLLLLREIRAVLMDVPHARPGVTIPLLMIASLLVFSAAYSSIARQSGEFHGLRTRVDALYFTVATVATVGYGDITAQGQTARILVMGQITYGFIFLTAAATALSRRLRRALGERQTPDGRRHGRGRRGRRHGDRRRGGGTGPGGGRPDGGAGRGTGRA